MGMINCCSLCSHANKERKNEDKIRCVKWHKWVEPKAPVCEEVAKEQLLNRMDSFSKQELLAMLNVARGEQVMNEWIKATDRLPPNRTNVLCWYEYFRYGNYNSMYQTYGIGYCINGHWGGEVMNGTKCRVIAWQELPEPPEGSVV